MFTDFRNCYLLWRAGAPAELRTNLFWATFDYYGWALIFVAINLPILLPLWWMLFMGWLADKIIELVGEFYGFIGAKALVARLENQRDKAREATRIWYYANVPGRNQGRKL